MVRTYHPANKWPGRLVIDWLGEFNPTVPLEYLCYAWCCFFPQYKAADSWAETTDTVFTWLEFDTVEHTTRRRLRLNQEPRAQKISRVKPTGSL